MRRHFAYCNDYTSSTHVNTGAVHPQDFARLLPSKVVPRMLGAHESSSEDEAEEGGGDSRVGEGSKTEGGGASSNLGSTMGRNLAAAMKSVIEAKASGQVLRKSLGRGGAPDKKGRKKVTISETRAEVSVGISAQMVVILPVLCVCVAAKAG